MEFEEESPVEVRNGPKKRFRKNKLKLVFNPEDRINFLTGFRKRKQERKEKYVQKLERDLAREKKNLKQQTQRAASKLSNSHSVLPEVQSLIENMPEKEETYDLGNTLVSITSLDDKIYRNVLVKKEDDDDDDDEDKDYRAHSKSSLKKLKEQKSDMFGGGDLSDDDNLSAAARSDPFFNPINDEEISNSDSSEGEERTMNYNPLEMLRKRTGVPDDSTDPTKLLSKAKLEKKANRMLQESEVFKKMQRIKQKRSKKFRLFRLHSAEASTEGSSKGGRKNGKPVNGKMCRLKVKGGGKTKYGKKRK